MNARDLRVIVELIVTAATQIYQRTLLHRDWPASPSTGDAPLAHTCTCTPYTVRLLHTVQLHVHCNTHTAL